VISEQPLQNTAAILVLITDRQTDSTAQHNEVVPAHNNQLLWFVTVQSNLREQEYNILFHQICSEGGRDVPAATPKPRTSTNCQGTQLAEHT
jgi:hypothetical protein